MKKKNYKYKTPINLQAFGGELNTQGGDFTNGLLSIDNGGSHETNPYEGVQLGIDPEGVPNLVEEGETVFNDYVFSKRLKVPKSIRNKYNLRGTKDLTFAEASKKLSKESEERPNDPISKRGLEAIMAELAYSQEQLKETQQVKKHALGGKLFDIGGNKAGNQPLNYDNSTQGLYFGSSPTEFNPYASDGTIDWNIMYGANSPYMKRRQYVLDNWDTEGVQNWLTKYVEGINEYNKGRDNYIPMTKENMTKDVFTRRTLDRSWGGIHSGIDYAGDPERNIVYKHMLRGEDALSEMPTSDIYYSGRDASTGRTWNEKFEDKYKILDGGKYTSTFDDKTNTETRTYYYDPVEAKRKKVNNYYMKNAEGKYDLVTGDNPYLQIANLGNYNQANAVENDTGGQDFYYDPKEEDPVIKPLDTRLRYAPAIGLGIASITDALGLTNKPDYSNADSLLEASRSAGSYQPVRFKPIGNYLTYRPFDRDYAINKMEAEAGATRRNLMNTSGGNRATAMAGILAADNNVLNQIGALTRQAEEYNLSQRKEVEDFNRETNKVNSQGFLQADMANQNALLNSRELTLKSNIAAAEMREKARLAADASKSANLSNFLNSLGNIGTENTYTNWRNFMAATDANLPPQYTGLLGRLSNTQKKANTQKKNEKKNDNKKYDKPNIEIVDNFMQQLKESGWSLENLKKNYKKSNK